jgi:hypothetical protein
MMKRRGRPATKNLELPQENTTQFTLTSFEYESEKVRNQGFKIVYNFDKNINPNGITKAEIIYPKNHKDPKVKPEKGKSYNGAPVVMVFKTSDRSNAKVKMKVWNNENIDYIISAPVLIGVPETAIVLELGVGKALIEKYTSKYSL